MYYLQLIYAWAQCAYKKIYYRSIQQHIKNKIIQTNLTIPILALDGHGYGTFYANQICTEFSVMIRQNAKRQRNKYKLERSTSVTAGGWHNRIA